MQHFMPSICGSNHTSLFYQGNYVIFKHDSLCIIASTVHIHPKILAVDFLITEVQLQAFEYPLKIISHGLRDIWSMTMSALRIRGTLNYCWPKFWWNIQALTHHILFIFSTLTTSLHTNIASLTSAHYTDMHLWPCALWLLPNMSCDFTTECMQSCSLCPEMSLSFQHSWFEEV